MNWKTKLYVLGSSVLLTLGLFYFQRDAVGNPVEAEVLPYYGDATFTPYWLALGKQPVADFHTIPPFTLVNQDGDTLTERTFDGKIYVANFFFTTCPGICPKMAENMFVLQERFLEDEEVLLMSHSVTPEDDSVAVLKKYAERNGIVSGKWHVVTGSRSDIYQLGRQEYFVEEDLGLERSTNEFLHTENFVLIDQNKHIRGIYNGLNRTSIKQLIADIELLKTVKGR